MLKRITAVFISLCIAVGSITAVFAEDSNELLFSDDFSQGGSKWTAVDGEAYKYDTAKGVLEFYSNNEDEVNITRGAANWKDYYETIRFTPTDIQYLGFYIRYKNESNHIAVKIYGREGKLKLLQKSGGGSYQLIKSISYAFSDNIEYELGIKVYGKRLEVYVNGELIGQTDKISIKEGGIGFNSLKSSAVIDSVEVSAVEDEYVEEAVGEVCNIYVSPTGDDSGDGSAERPFKTFETAHQAVNIRKIGNTPVNVIFKEGTYEFTDTIKLTKNDSGTESAPVTYMAEPGKKVVFTAAKKLDISKFKPVTAGSALERVNKKAKGKLMQYDLTALGIDESVYAMETNAQMLYPYYPPGIFLNDKSQELSRWPNDGWNYFGEVVDGGGTAQSTWNGEKTVAQVQNQGAVFKYDQLNPSLWKSVDGAYIMGFFGTEYRSEWARLSGLDQSNQTISLAHYTSYGVKPQHRWAIVNLLDEIDLPGEWCIDKEKHMLYYWPTHTLTNEDTVEITGMTSELVNMTGVENIVIDGITFEKSRADGLILENCNNITINGCEIKDFVYNAIKLTYCSNINITGNNIKNTGEAAIRLYRCGNRKTLESSNILIDNNIAYNLSKWTSYGGGIAVDGEIYSTTCVGVTVTHNTISRGDCGLGGGTGVDLEIAYNEMFDGVRNASDAAMMYGGRLFSEFDSRIEYNYVHDLGSINSSGVYSVNGIFLDDLESGRYVCNNIINVNNMVNTGGIKMGGGRDNKIQYNTIIGATKGLLLEDRTSGKADDYIFTYAAYSYLLRDIKNGIDYHSSPWIDKHPGISALMKDIETDGKYLPKNNLITDNVIYNCETNQYPSHVAEYSTIENNAMIEEDIFVDSAKQDFRIKFSAKEKYNLSDNLIYEDFDLDQIGSSRLAVFEKDFKLLYPENEAEEIETRDLWISWEMQDYANEYYYTVATDPEFKNVVEEGRTLKTFTELKNIENGKKYYWKVSAKNISRKQQGEWDSPSGVFSFTTADENEVIKTPLGSSISSARKQLTQISEGNEIGKYKPGTKQMLNSEINTASKVFNNVDAKQSDVEAASNRLNNFVSTISQNLILGYQKLNVGSASDWLLQNVEADIRVSGSDGAVEIMRDSKTIGTVYRDEKYSTASILCFDINIESYNGTWLGVSIKQTDPKQLPYGVNYSSSYLLVVKEDVIEFQRYNMDKKVGGIITTIPNTVLKAGEWHSIQYGALPCSGGAYIVFNVDGEEVFSFKDTEAPFYDDGYVTILPTLSKVSVRESENIPKESFTVPAEEKVDKVYTPADSVFTAVGEWNKSEGSGYEGSAAYSSSNPSSSLKWSMDEGKGIENYRIYIWNDKAVNTDKNATVKVTNYSTDEKLTLDMTAQNDGWVDIGVYRFISAAVTSECMVELIPSGDGTLCAGAIRIVKVNGDEEETQTIKQNNGAFSDIADVEWAKDGIEALSEKNVLSGTGDGRFEPNAPVKREELAKMIVAAFDFSGKENAKSFSDVSDSEWYAEYIAVSNSNGIVNGMDEYSFGTGNNITREELAAMLYRAALLKQKAFEGKKTDFADMSDVAEYAVEAVASLSGAGIISGMENNTFMPREQATRAQAAKLIWEILKTI